MKPYPRPSLNAVFGLLCLLGAAACGCTSTETGNPGKDSPGPEPPLTGIPVELQFGLRGAQPEGVDTAGAGAVITGLWLQVSEVEFITCAGSSQTSEGPGTNDNLTTRQPLPVIAPDEPICAIVVRTAPLDAATNADVPMRGAGQGAVIEGRDVSGSAFSAVIPERITSVLIPASQTLTLGDAQALRLTIEDHLLLAPVASYGNMQLAAEPNNYDQSNAPDLVLAMAAQLNVAFTLERGDADPEKREVLATATMNWSEVDDLLCASECSLQDRSACGDTPCDVPTCLDRLDDPVCGETFRSALHCRVSMQPDEYSCVDGMVSVEDTHCALPDSTYVSCGGL